MKECITSFALFLICNVCFANEIYVYPKKIEINLSCDPEDGKLYARSLFVDLNADGVCELYYDNPPEYEGNGYSFTSVEILQDGSYRWSGDIQWEPDKWWYGEFRNGYPRIFVSTYTGHRTNPIWVTDVYYFNGSRYVLEFDSEYSYGQFKDLGLKAYKNKNYALAEKWYLNAYRMKKVKNINDARNLALTYIKQGRCSDALSLLNKYLDNESLTAKQIRSVQFNLMLCKRNKTLTQ